MSREAGEESARTLASLVQRPGRGTGQWEDVRRLRMVEERGEDGAECLFRLLSPPAPARGALVLPRGLTLAAPGECWEISGPEGSGKQEALLEAASMVLAPSSAGGLGRRLLWLDASARFVLQDLESELAARLSSLAAAEQSGAMEGCLGRLAYARVADSGELGDRLAAAEELCLAQLRTDAGTAFWGVVIDGVSESRLLRRLGRSARAEWAAQARAAGLLSRLSQRLGLAVLASRRSVLVPPRPEDVLRRLQEPAAEEEAEPATPQRGQLFSEAWRPVQRSPEEAEGHNESTDFDVDDEVCLRIPWQPHNVMAPQWQRLFPQQHTLQMRESEEAEDWADAALFMADESRW